MRPPSEAPERLRTLQRDFGALLRVPLDGSSGRFESAPDAIPEALLARIAGVDEARRRARLVVYHRQVWFRYFQVVQGEFPLTTRLLGAFALNRCVAAFLAHHPPHGTDLGRLADGFASFVLAWDARPKLARVCAQPLPDDALAEALAADQAFRLASRQAPKPLYRPTLEDAQRLAGARFVGASGLSFVRGRRGLLALRAGLRGDDPRSTIVCPEPEERTRVVAVYASEVGIARAELSEEQAEFYALAMRMPVGDVLTRMLAADAARSTDEPLGVRIQRYVALGFERGLLVGLHTDEEPRT